MKRPTFMATLVAFGVTLAVLVAQPALAATLCVNVGGTGGCYKKIATAVSKAAPGDTINVGAGTYKEDVIIGKSLSLIGAGRNSTIIDATGLANAIYIDGLDNPGLNTVVVRGFSANNANFEGILITNASNVTVSDNKVLNNNISLDITNVVCTNQPDFETDEGFDCGEGIHLSGVDHSTIANNIVENNAGGILLSDDTGETHDNVVTGNLVQNNPFDCGITLASHAPGPGSAAPHLGIVHNTIEGNSSNHNGFQIPGAGAGVGIFADGTGVGLVSGNVIAYNRLTGNGIGGVVFHSHVGPNFGLPADDLNDNQVIGNKISGNGADLFDTATPGRDGINVSSGGGGTPITGTVITQNTITDEDQDIVLATPGQVEVHLNNLVGATEGVDNLSTGTGDVTENWWGCVTGPNTAGCTSATGSPLLDGTWLTSPFRLKGIISVRVFMGP